MRARGRTNGRRELDQRGGKQAICTSSVKWYGIERGRCSLCLCAAASVVWATHSTMPLCIDAFALHWCSRCELFNLVRPMELLGSSVVRKCLSVCLRWMEWDRASIPSAKKGKPNWQHFTLIRRSEAMNYCPNAFQMWCIRTRERNQPDHHRRTQNIQFFRVISPFFWLARLRSISIMCARGVCMYGTLSFAGPAIQLCITCLQVLFAVAINSAWLYWFVAPNEASRKTNNAFAEMPFPLSTGVSVCVCARVYCLRPG